jgi:structural maintenance of chromosome 3 (chondroitin sulfate proteoglycan 6)
MHIKQVLISGFRSFRNQTEIENFSSKHNVIVGRNGSGKSNFFDAIQFVLVAPKFATLRQEDRQNLLHEGAGSSVMAAYVEIVFDNHDGRLSVDSDEVVIRRTVGHKKDEFFLNRKHVSKGEIISLLETAGFSRSNPYYIVQQGKVANLCTMNDRARLNLLKEVAGTTVYEERRAESIKVMDKTLSEQAKIEEVLDYLNERLSELDEEKSELVEYEKLDRQRRALEFNLHEKEFRDAQRQLEELELQREELRERQITLHSSLRDQQDELGAEDDKLVSARSAYDRLKSRLNNKRDELSKLESRQGEVEVQLQENQEKLQQRQSVLASSKSEMSEIDDLIRQRQQQMQQMSPQINLLMDRQQREMDELHQLRKRAEILYAKQGRGRQFSSKAERDRFLQSQVDLLSEQIRKNEVIVHRKTADFEREEVEISKEERELTALDAEVIARRQQYESQGQLMKEQIAQINQLVERKKVIWREIETLRDSIKEAEQNNEKGKQQLSKTLPRAISDGLKTVEYIVQQKNIKGYYGPLIDNISLRSDAFRTAVEVAAGNNLFNVVVDNDDTAAVLIKELERAKVGRLTFLPLNRLRIPQFRYPDPSEKEVHPLISVALNYDPEVEAAVRLVFGSKLIARNIDVAARFSREFHMDAITMEGDVVYSRGNFEGGFHDDRVSRIAAVLKIREATELCQALKAQIEKLTSESTALEAQVNDLRGSVQRLEVERQNLQNLSEQQTKDHVSRTKKLNAAIQALHNGRREIQSLQTEIDSIREQISVYQREMKTSLTQRLTEQEISELRTTEERISQLQLQHDDTKKEVALAVADHDQLKIELETGLMKRREELLLRLKLSSADGDNYNEDLDAAMELLQAESALLASNILAVQREAQEISGAIEQKAKIISELEEELDEKRESEKLFLQQLITLNVELDRLVTERSSFMDTMDSRQRLIRDLGAIPSKEQMEFQSLSVAHLSKQLKSVQEKLKKFSAVNRKALDQYVSFNEQRETLLERKKEIERDANSIEELIASLDNQKNEAIMRTFTGVSRHFADVFAELVPGGKGQLIMKSTIDGEPANSDTATGDLEDHILHEEQDVGINGSRLSVAQFRGVEVSVSFTGVGQHYTMQQLSGGQKALVALAVIFAIQRCDPAPFYLFDEIDQALDANYRTTVARLIQRQANSDTANAQFITTTFRPELVQVADKFFGIKLENKVSNLIPLTKDDAADFVTNLLQDEEAVLRPSSFVQSTPSVGRNQISGLGSSTETHRGDRTSGIAMDVDDEEVVERSRRSGRGLVAAIENDEEEEEDDRALSRAAGSRGSKGKQSNTRSGKASTLGRRSKKRIRGRESGDAEGDGSDEEDPEEGLDLDEEDEKMLRSLGLK